MRNPFHVSVTDIRFAPANAALQSRGLLGWVICSYGDLELRCLQVRRTAEGKCAIAFPHQRDAHGTKHPVVRPLDQAARDAIEAQVLGELRRRGRLT